MKNNLKNDQRTFWYYINESKKNQIPVDIISKDKIVENDIDLANSFATFFQNTYSNNETISDTSEIQINNTRMDTILRTETDIAKAIKRLKPNQSPGYDKTNHSF